MNRKPFEIVILSGKGGTGKTSLVAAMAGFTGKCVFADCDVDAADLHLIFQPDILKEESFHSGSKAEIDQQECTSCGVCMDLCRFHAIRFSNGKYTIDPFACEGCGLCEVACPAEAIRIEENYMNALVFADSRFGPLVYGRLGIGEENSGKLVSEVRKNAREKAVKTGADWILVDGPPGIGCPAISSVTGADLVIAVTEPSRSGWHDLDRLLEMTGKFKTPVGVVINKYDLRKEMSEQIEKELEQRKLPVLAKISYEEKVVHALVEGKSLPEALPGHPLVAVFREIWGKIEQMAGHR